MASDCQPPDWESYGTIVKKIDTALALSKADRREQIKIALDATDDDFVDVLQRVVKDNDGRKNPARRALNEQLEAAEHYNHDTYGLVSTATFYDWCDEYLGDTADR